MKKRVDVCSGELADTYEELAALYEVTHIINAHLNLETVLDTIARSTAELLETDTGVILLLDPDGQSLRIHGAYGLSEAVIQGTRDRIGESLAGRVVQQGTPIIANDLPNDSRFVNPATVDEGLLACASVPLRVGDRIIGTLDVHSKTNRWAFTESHIGVLEMLAGQAAIAIENARLYENLQQAHDELETRVQKRTAELAASNQHLQHEMAERQRMTEKLGRERNLLKTLIDHLPDYIFVKNVNCRFILVNNLSEISAHPGSHRDTLIGKTDFDLFPQELAQKYYEDDQRILQTGEAIINQEEPALDLVTGTKRWRSTSKIPFLDAQEQVAGLVGISRDITDQKLVKEALQRRNRELTALNDMNEMLQTCRSEEDTYKIIGSVCEQLFAADSGGIYLLDGARSAFALVACWGDSQKNVTLVSVEDCPALHADHLHTLPSSEHAIDRFCPDSLKGPNSICVPIRTSDDVLGIFHLSCEPQAGGYFDDAWEDSDESKQMLIRRITGQYALFLMNVRLNERLRMEAIRDPLTGLYNRRYMEASLDREAYRAAREQNHLGILMLDIDHFKRFNDTYGHEAGDMVLRELGGFLLSRTRGEDIACRYGGEEFLVILSGASSDSARKRAEELCEGIRNLRIKYHGALLSVTISIGVASLCKHEPHIANVVKAADRALYQAKAEGRDRVVVAFHQEGKCVDKCGEVAIIASCDEISDDMADNTTEA